MQKVGMTKQEIRRSINAQVLTVFFAPLLLAGVHLAFAFSLIWNLLKLLDVNNLTLLIWVNVICFLALGVLYGVVYYLTSRTYYRIVSGAKAD
jgi:putative ABC transport system permease protein